MNSPSSSIKQLQWLLRAQPLPPTPTTKVAPGSIVDKAISAFTDLQADEPPNSVEDSTSQTILHAWKPTTRRCMASHWRTFSNANDPASLQGAITFFASTHDNPISTGKVNALVNAIRTARIVCDETFDPATRLSYYIRGYVARHKAPPPKPAGGITYSMFCKLIKTHGEA